MSDIQLMSNFLSEREKTFNHIHKDELQSIIDSAKNIGNQQVYNDAVIELIKNNYKPVKYISESKDGTFILENASIEKNLYKPDIILRIFDLPEKGFKLIIGGDSFIFPDQDHIEFDFPLVIPPIQYIEIQLRYMNDQPIKEFKFEGITVDSDIHNKLLYFSSKINVSLHKSLPDMIYYGGTLMDARAKNCIFII